MRYLDQLNSPDHNPLNWLTTHLPRADALYATVGYLDQAGVRLVENPLRDLLDRGGHAHIIVDARDDRPRRSDLAWILNLFAPYGDRATITLHTDPAPLHAKVFALANGDTWERALVGSANFTGAGLSRNYEACIEVTADDEALQQVRAATMARHEQLRASRVDLGVLASMEEATRPTGRSVPFADLIAATMDEIENIGTGGGPTGVPTGFLDVDRMLTGLHTGQLILIAGRPAMGKSTMALNVAQNAAMNHGVPTLFLSFEMSTTELMFRAMSARAGVPLHLIRSAQLSDSDWTRMAKQLERDGIAQLFINDTCRTSIRHVAEEARRAVREDGVRLVVIDYLQLLNVDRRVESRQQEISEISRSLKRLAVELRVPVVAVSQLNRSPEGRPDKRPLLSDLRDSGSLEQDSDVVILVHRDDYYDPESPNSGEADFIIAKHRNGPTDIITVAAQLHLSRFVDMAI